jgi:hypothetical protein
MPRPTRGEWAARSAPRRARHRCLLLNVLDLREELSLPFAHETRIGPVDNLGSSVVVRVEEPTDPHRRTPPEGVEYRGFRAQDTRPIRIEGREVPGTNVLLRRDGARGDEKTRWEAL